MSAQEREDPAGSSSAGPPTRRDLFRIGGALGVTAVAGSLLSAGHATATTTPVADGPAPDGVRQRVVTYKTVDSGPLNLHLWAPDPWMPGVRHPALVFYHGGGWRNGTWRKFEQHAAYFAGRGLIAISVEYRTEGPVVATLDAVDAFNHVIDHAADLGIDRDNVVTAGGSAGGHLALSTLRDDLLHSVPGNHPCAIAVFSPVTNTTGRYPDGWGRGQFDDDAQAELYSPYHHIGAGHPPVLILHSTSDRTVGFANSVEYAQKVRASGGQAALVSYDAQPHAFFNARVHYNRHYYETVREVDRFLASLGHLTGPPAVRPEPAQLVRNSGFENGLKDWSAAHGTTPQVAREPTHGGRLAVRVAGESGPRVLTHDLTEEVRRHGAGEYLLSAWLAVPSGSTAEASLTLHVRGSDDPESHNHTVPAEQISGDGYLRISGTRRVGWAGDLEDARLDVSVTSDHAWIDDVRVEFLPARIGWWRLSDGAGAVASDSSGFGLDATLVGGTWTDDGRPGGCVRFDGADGGLELPNVVDPAHSDFALRLWVRMDETTTTRQTIVRQADPATGTWLYWDPESACLATEIDGTPLIASTPTATGTWTEVALVRAGGRSELYVGGNRVAARTGTSVPSSRASMIIGAPIDADGSAQGWHGAIDEISFFDHAPSALSSQS